MKVVIEVCETLQEDVITISCSKITQDVLALQRELQKKVGAKKEIVAYKNEVEYFIKLSDVLFFEVYDREVMLHTKDDVYRVKGKLYALEESLPTQFVQISKSALVNIMQVHSIDKSLGAGGVIAFENTHKQVSISRMYYKNLKEKLKGFRR